MGQLTALGLIVLVAPITAVPTPQSFIQTYQQQPRLNPILCPPFRSYRPPLPPLPSPPPSSPPPCPPPSPCPPPPCPSPTSPSLPYPPPPSPPSPCPSPPSPSPSPNNCNDPYVKSEGNIIGNGIDTKEVDFGGWTRNEDIDEGASAGTYVSGGTEVTRRSVKSSAIPALLRSKGFHEIPVPGGTFFVSPTSSIVIKPPRVLVRSPLVKPLRSSAVLVQPQSTGLAAPLQNPRQTTSSPIQLMSSYASIQPSENPSHPQNNDYQPQNEQLLVGYDRPPVPCPIKSTSSPVNYKPIIPSQQPWLPMQPPQNYFRTPNPCPTQNNPPSPVIQPTDNSDIPRNPSKTKLTSGIITDLPVLRSYSSTLQPKVAYRPSTPYLIPPSPIPITPLPVSKPGTIQPSTIYFQTSLVGKDSDTSSYGGDPSYKADDSYGKEKSNDGTGSQLDSRGYAGRRAYGSSGGIRETDKALNFFYKGINNIRDENLQQLTDTDPTSFYFNPNLSYYGLPNQNQYSGLRNF